MKKILSMMLALAAVITCVTTSSITASAASPVEELYAVMKQSDGLVVNGKSYDSIALAKLLKVQSPIVTSIAGYEYQYQNEYDDFGYFWRSDRRIILMSNNSSNYENQENIVYYDALYDAVKGGVVPAAQAAEANKPCQLMSANSDIYNSVTGGFTTNELAARNINAQFLASYMQAHNFTSAEDVVKYLMANGVVFCKVDIVDTGKTGRDKYKTTRTPMPSDVVLSTPSDSGPYSAVIGNLTISYSIDEVSGGGTIVYDDNGGIISDTSLSGRGCTLGISDSKNQFRISSTMLGNNIRTTFGNSPYEYQKTEL